MIRDELGRIYTVTQAEWDRVLHEKNQALIQIWDQTGPEDGRQARDRVWYGIFAVTRVKDEAVETAVQTREQAKEEHDDPR